LRVTLILDPALGVIVWAHLAPPLLDGLRKAYRTLLRWNDEFPLVKFSIADDGRPIAAVEIPSRWLDVDEIGLALARVAGVADRVFEETRGWLWIGGRAPDGSAGRPSRRGPRRGRSRAQGDQSPEGQRGPARVLPDGRPHRAAGHIRLPHHRRIGQPEGVGRPAGSDVHEPQDRSRSEPRGRQVDHADPHLR